MSRPSFYMYDSNMILRSVSEDPEVSMFKASILEPTAQASTRNKILLRLLWTSFTTSEVKLFEIGIFSCVLR
jgi:hypothetical protein